MWVFDTRSEAVLYPLATSLSAPHVLPEGFSLDVYMSPEQKSTGRTDWLYYTFGPSQPLFLLRSRFLLIDTDMTDTVIPSASTNTSTVTFTPSHPDWITSEVMSSYDPPSWGTTLLGVISKLGGVFVTINGIFVIVFGRTVWAVIAGTFDRFARLEEGVERWICVCSQAADLSLPLASSATSRGSEHRYTNTTHDSNPIAKAMVWQDF